MFDARSKRPGEADLEILKHRYGPSRELPPVAFQGHYARFVEMRPLTDAEHAYVLATIGDQIPTWPGGWPDEIDAALIDAVFSVRAHYGSREDGRESGVYGAVQRWRRQRVVANDLRVLTRTTVEELRAITNSGKIRGRYKAEVVSDAAAALVRAKIVTAADLQTRESAARAAYLSVSGCGPVTWRYLRMLVGSDDVKPDTWVMRFVRDKLPKITDTDDAAALITAVAGRMGVDARNLDHAIWRYRRANPGAHIAAPNHP